MAGKLAATSVKPYTVPSLEQLNAEIFTMTYGSIVRQLIEDFEDIEDVNKQLDQMGYNIGIRLIDEFLAKSKISRCTSFKETADVIAKQALYMFLNITANVTNWNAEGTECSLVNMDVECKFTQDMLKGDDAYEIRMRLKDVKAEKFPFKEND